MVALCLMVAIVAAPAVGGAADTVPDRGIGLRPAPAVTQERRVALVIGNSGYRYDRLLNPVNDARDFADALRGLGFDVEAHLDADRRTMRKAIIDFGRRLGDGGVGLFYFAGHGVRVGDENYLIPVGAAIDVEEHVEVDAVGLNQVVARMGGARNRLNIVILDACRNNPFASRFRSPVRGLAQTRAPRGTYIAYATAPGEVASDGDGAHSLYTAARLEGRRRPGPEAGGRFQAGPRPGRPTHRRTPGALDLVFHHRRFFLSPAGGGRRGRDSGHHHGRQRRQGSPVLGHREGQRQPGVLSGPTWGSSPTASSCLWRG